MTHTTGTRPKIKTQLQRNMEQEIRYSGATITEVFETIHEIQMNLVHLMLEPWEDATCPTTMKKRSKQLKKQS